MSLSTILQDVSLEDFLEKYIHRIPLPQPGGAAEYASLGTWDTIETLLASGGDVDVLLVKDNRRVPTDRVPTIEQIRQLNGAGHTLVLRHTERHDERLARLAEAFHQELLGPVNVHLYCTPPGQHGFGWHYDAEDVFILQTQGVKEYSLRKNTVHPWPVLESMPGDLQFERERSPLMKCKLIAGDALYVPAGYWHRADGGGDDDAISLAIGVLPRSAVEIYDFLRRVVLGSLVWRQRLPVVGEASGLSEEETRERFRTLCADLGKDLSYSLSDPQIVDAFLETLRTEPAPTTT